MVAAVCEFLVFVSGCFVEYLFELFVCELFCLFSVLRLLLLHKLFYLWLVLSAFFFVCCLSLQEQSCARLVFSSFFLCMCVCVFCLLGVLLSEPLLRRPLRLQAFLLAPLPSFVKPFREVLLLPSRDPRAVGHDMQYFGVPAPVSQASWQLCYLLIVVLMMMVFGGDAVVVDIIVAVVVDVDII